MNLQKSLNLQKSQPFTLFHYWRSSCSWRVRWALELKGIRPPQVVYHSIGLLDGEVDSESYKKRNPMGMVPALEIQGKYLGQSLAIIQWIEDLHPAPSLYLRDASPWERAKMTQLTEIVNADTQPLQNLTPQQLHSADPEARKKWAQYFIETGLKGYEAVVRETAGTWSIGDQVSVADLCLIPQVYNAVRYDVSLDAMPICKRIYEHARKTPECTAASPETYEHQK